jgi:hypothetical protein
MTTLRAVSEIKNVERLQRHLHNAFILLTYKSNKVVLGETDHSMLTPNNPMVIMYLCWEA